MKRPSTHIALLRGINVGGHNKIPMAELRSLCSDIGHVNVQSYIQSGNLVFSSSSSKPAAIEVELEKAIEKRFGFAVAVVVRTGTDWADFMTGNPFAKESESEPNRVMMGLAKLPLKKEIATDIQERATGGERVIQIKDALWFHFGKEVASSKLTPALLNKMAGSPVTVRNWRTVQQLGGMAAR